MMIKKQVFQLFWGCLFIILAVNVIAETRIRHGEIEKIDWDTKKIYIREKLKGINLGLHQFNLKPKKSTIKVWANERRIYPTLLEKGMKVVFEIQSGSLYSIYVTDAKGKDLEPHG